MKLRIFLAILAATIFFVFLNKDEITFRNISKVEASTTTNPGIEQDPSAEERFMGSGTTEDIKLFSSYFCRNNDNNPQMAIIEVGFKKKSFYDDPIMIYTKKAPGIIIPGNIQEMVVKHAERKTVSSVSYVSIRWAKRSEKVFCKSDRYDGRYEHIPMQ